MGSLIVGEVGRDGAAWNEHALEVNQEQTADANGGTLVDRRGGNPFTASLPVTRGWKPLPASPAAVSPSFRVECWCGKVIRAGDPGAPTSHGPCDVCFAKWRADRRVPEMCA